MPGRTILLIAVITLAACGGEAATGPAPRTAQVQISAFRFQPTDLAVPVGTTVTWFNGDEILHTVTGGTSVKKDEFGNCDIAPDGRISGTLPEKGQTFSFTFTIAGEYQYFCSRHNNMTARVGVR